MNEIWLDELVNTDQHEVAVLLREPGRWPTSERAAWEHKVIRQVLRTPYREAVVSVHKSRDGAKMARRNMLDREPWQALADVAVHQRTIGGGYAAVVVKYVPTRNRTKEANA